MASSGGPDTISDGLVLALDAANKISYPGSGTSWYDLIGTTRGTLTNGPTFNNGNNGNIVFDGVDDYVPLNSSITLGNTFTINAFIKLTGNNADTSVVGTDANGGDNWFGVFNNKVFAYYTQISDVNNSSVVGNTTLLNNLWYCISVTINVSTVTLYLNGVFDGTKTESFTIGGWTGFYAVGRRSYGIAQRYFYGSIANVTLYNRVLSSSEILQNYNDTKTRFGILS